MQSPGQQCGARTVSYTYDAAGNESSITYPGGSNAVTYGYDDANEMTSVTDWNASVTGYAYDDAGRMTTETLPNGITGTASYDDAGRLTGIGYSDGSTSVASADYTLDAAGNRLTRTDASGTQTYTYDALNRLATATGPGTTSDTYTYDAFGNRTQLVDGSGTTTTAYNAGNEITSVTPPSPGSAVTYTYDADGNLTARGSDSFSWDYENRPTSATVGGSTTTYTYSGDGLRQSSTTGGTTTNYTWDVNRSLPVVLDDGTNQYIYGLGGTPLAQVSTTGTVYDLADGLGSTMATTDASGSVVNAYAYDPYGATTSSTGSQPNPFQFAGQQTDPTGLQYLRARYYDPATGTFLSSDPMGVGPSWPGNPYLYANGNPALLVDPYGLFGIPGWHDITSGAENVGGFVGGQIQKHLPGGDALTNLSDLQTVLGVVTAASCETGVLEVCVVAGTGYVAATLAKTVVLHADEANHSMGSGEAECRYLTEVPLPFPFSSIASGVCGAIGAATAPAGTSRSETFLGEKQL